MRLDLKKISFGRRLSRHLIYEETDNNGAGWTRGLYLALAAEGSTPLIGGPATGPKGLFRVTPIAGTTPQDYSYTASPFIVELKTEKGAIRFALDGEKVLRIEGSGVGLRLDGKLGFGGNAVMTGRGAEILQGGIVYLIKALKGKINLDCSWQLKALRCTDPVVTVEPDDAGAFDIAIVETNDAYELPVIAESVERSAEASEADYRRFADGLTERGPEYAAFFDLAAYTLWMSTVPFKGLESTCSNKMNDQKFYAVEQPILTLPLKSAARSLEIIAGFLGFASPLGLVPAWAAERQNLYEAVPPVYAFPVSRLTENGRLGSVPLDQLSAFYELMSKAVNWWLRQRANADGLVYYAYRHECTWECDAVFSCGVPAAAPDLAAYIALASEALSKVAALLDKPGDVDSWNAMSKKQLDILTRVLWDKDHFRSVNTFTGEAGTHGAVSGLIPLILGRRLPTEIGSALAAQAKTVCWEEVPVIPASMIILGLREWGNTLADTAASRLIASCLNGTGDARGKGAAAGTFYSPAACAALLALGGQSLQ